VFVYIVVTFSLSNVDPSVSQSFSMVFCSTNLYDMLSGLPPKSVRVMIYLHLTAGLFLLISYSETT
jgi:hypothetical protein